MHVRFPMRRRILSARVMRGLRFIRFMRTGSLRSRTQNIRWNSFCATGSWQNGMRAERYFCFGFPWTIITGISLWIVMKDGIIQQVDTPQNLYDMPCNMFVAGFIGSPQMNFLDGTIVKKGDQYSVDLGGDLIPLPKEKTADGKLDSYVGKKVKMGIRPEDIDDEPEFMAKHTDCQLDAQVDVSEMMGAEIYLYLEYKGNKNVSESPQGK